MKKIFVLLLVLLGLYAPAHADVQECLAGQDCYLLYIPSNKNDSNTPITDLSESTGDFFYYWNDTGTTATQLTEATPDVVDVFQIGSTGNYKIKIPSAANIITAGNAGKTFCVYVVGHSAITTNRAACVYVKTKSDENTVARMPSTGTVSSHAAADVWSVGTRVLTANTNLNDPSAATIADAVWDEAQSGHITAGTFGKYLDAQVSGVGGGGAADWTTDEKNQLRYRLGIDGTEAAPATNTPSLGTVDANVLTNTDKTGYALTQAFPSNFSALAITAGGAVTAGTVNDKTGYGLSTAGVDAILDDTVEGAYTMRQILCALAATQMGKSSGGGTTTITFRNLSDTANRVTGTVDANRNRTAVTLNLTGCQ